MMDEKIVQLEARYCPPIDGALFSAIISDYDLSDGDALDQATLILESLKASALEEEAAGFDPSGSSGAGDVYQDKRDENSSSVGGTSSHPGLSGGEGTAFTNTTLSLSSLVLEGDSRSDAEEDTRLDGISAGLGPLDGPQEKEALLQEMFPTVKPYTVTHTLRKCNDDFDKAAEELLNQVFFVEEEESGSGERILMKGVDGFAEEVNPSVGRKSRRAKRNKKHDGLKLSTRPSSAPPGPGSVEYGMSIRASKWEMARQDMDFIVSRTQLPRQTVSSTYHKHGASIAATIRALLEIEKTKDLSESGDDDPTLEVAAFELRQKYPTVTADLASSLVRVAHPSTEAAYELAEAMIKPSVSAAEDSFDPAVNIQIIPPRPPPLSDAESGWTAPRSRKALTSTSTSASSSSSSSANDRLPAGSAAALAGLHHQARATAFAQASAAYRRGRSDHLMGGAAAYYSQLGREHGSKARAYTKEAADALVDAQSSGVQLDLHGVGVRDAVRIVREKVTAWWVEVVSQRERTPGSRAGVGTGFKIVTGVGRHSEGGRARIGPAVGSMLLREGWKVQIGEGVLVVSGVARTR